MMKNEASFVAEILKSLSDLELSPLLNIGSSTAYFRNVSQPEIGRLIFVPLAERGIRVIHVDIKDAEGVDLVANICNDKDLETVVETKPNFTICSNVLEHVEDPRHFAACLSKIVPPGGKLLITVPFSFPYHPDPIDNSFRPSPVEVASLFPGFQIVKSKVCEEGTLAKKIGGDPVGVIRRLVRTLLPFYRPRGWASCVHHWFWLFRTYKVSVVLLQKTGA